MSKTSLQKSRRQSPSTMPQLTELMLDDEHAIVVERKSLQKWHVRFFISPEQKRKEKREFNDARLRQISMLMPRRLVAVVVRYPDHGYDKAAEKQFQVLLGGTEEWFDMLAPALDRARQWIITQDAVKRLRGE